jgi:3-hydroxypropanoate dehydrogenase
MIAERTRTDSNDHRASAQSDVRNLRERIQRLDQDSLDLILTGARSHHTWTSRPVTDDDIRALYEKAKMGATSMNGCPARFVFVRTVEGKERLAKAVKPTNIAKMIGAPVCTIVAYDPEFWRELPKLFPHEDRRPHFSDKPEYAEETAFRNSTLQGGYLMMAARAMGFDVGAMSGFSNEIVDQEFFAGTTWKSNFLCNIGYGDESGLFPQLPRFEFDEVCKLK